MTSRQAPGRSTFPRTAASAALAVTGAGAADASIWLHYIFKPLTTFLIFLTAWRIANPVNARYRKAILAGIALSLCGDVFLMLPKSVLPTGFLLGLSSFLIAHLFFLRAFTSDARIFHAPLTPAAFLLFGAVNLAVLWPGLASGLKVPVTAYVVCLVAMASQAVSRHLQLRTPHSRLAAIGAVFFVLSDTLLAYNRFYAPIPASALLILATYYTALLLIARSVASRADSI